MCRRLSPLLEPSVSILDFGWRISRLIDGKFMVINYLTFVSAGILVMTGMVRAVLECTYGAYFRMVYQSIYDAILSTPIGVTSLGSGEILWGATKATFDSIIILIILLFWGSEVSSGASDFPVYPSRCHWIGSHLPCLHRLDFLHSSIQLLHRSSLFFHVDLRNLSSDCPSPPHTRVFGLGFSPDQRCRSVSRPDDRTTRRSVNRRSSLARDLWFNLLGSGSSEAVEADVPMTQSSPVPSSRFSLFGALCISDRSR